MYDTIASGKDEANKEQGEISASTDERERKKVKKTSAPINRN